MSAEQTLGVVAHAYQPEREIFRYNGSLLTVFPEINETIYQQTYYPLLVEPKFNNLDGEKVESPLRNGLIMSLYTPLREWIRTHHPKDFQKIRESITSLPNKEYQLLGDPYIHAILPLLPDEDQRMLLAVGRQAFFEDFGFYPKGLWLPETAVSTSTLRLAKEAGYEFTVLADYQVENPSGLPVYVDIGDGKFFAVFPFSSGPSATLSYEDYYSVDAHTTLTTYLPQTSLLATDAELYGHHKKDRDQFLLALLHFARTRRGTHVLDAKKLLQANHALLTHVKDNSSWSCPHGNLGRWTGACNCGDPTPTPQVISEKKHLFTTLSSHNNTINDYLDTNYPNWRSTFLTFTVNNKNTIFNGKDFLTPLEQLCHTDTLLSQLLAAKIYTLLGFTSCGWFFSQEDGIERKIPATMAQDVEDILQNILPPTRRAS